MRPATDVSCSKGTVSCYMTSDHARSVEPTDFTSITICCKTNYDISAVTVCLRTASRKHAVLNSWVL